MGGKLGANAAKRGLSADEQAVYRNSLGDLCNRLKSASRSSLASSSVRNASSLSLNFNKMGANAVKRGLNTDEQARYRGSLGDLAARLMNTSSRSTSLARSNSLASEPPTLRPSAGVPVRNASSWASLDRVIIAFSHFV